MNITQTFRRKHKYHNPILVFKELYRDYFAHSRTGSHFLQKRDVPQQNHPNSQSNISILQGKLPSSVQDSRASKLTKTKSAEEFSKYLRQHGDPGVSLLNFTRNSKSNLNRSKSLSKTNTVFTMLEGKNLQESSKEKRGYFKNSYERSHPLFQKHPNFFQQKIIEPSQSNIHHILPDLFQQTGNRLKTPFQKRVELQQLKTKLNERKQTAVQNFRKVRHNFLIKKTFKFKKQNAQNNECFKTLMQSKNSFQKTKFNIFPQTNL